MDDNNIVFTLIASTVAIFWLRGREEKIKSLCKGHFNDEHSGKYSGYRSGEPMRRLSREILQGHLLMLIVGTGIGSGFNETVWLVVSIIGF